MARFLGFVLAASLAVSLAACGGDAGSATDPFAGLFDGSISGKFNGVPFSIQGLTATADYDPDTKVFGIAGFGETNDLSITIAAENVAGTGTYPVTLVGMTNRPGSWTYVPGTGTITISTWSGRHVIGTYAFDLDDDSSSPPDPAARVHVTEGKYDLTY